MKVLVPVVIGLLVVGCGKKQHSGKTQAGDNANKPKFTIEEIDELKKKSEAGDGEAMHDLGQVYYDGEGVTQDYKEAARWWILSSDANSTKWSNHSQYKKAWCLYYLGNMHAGGRGFPKDLGEAMNWWQKSAERGDPDAAFSLAEAYFNGEGTSIDLIKACAWYEVALLYSIKFKKAKEKLALTKAKMTPKQISEAWKLNYQLQKKIQQTRGW